MTFEVRVPTLGESIVEATVSKWLKREGEYVAAGEPLLEIETDKVNLEVAAEASGIIQSIAAGEGTTVAINDLLAVITPSETRAPDISASPPQPVAPPQPEPTQSPNGGDALATPVAQRVAAEYEIDIQAISGSGPGGRVTKEDVLKHVQQPPTPVAPPQLPMPAVTPPTPPVTPVVLPPGPSQPTAPPASPTLSATPALPPILKTTADASRREERLRMTRRRQTIARRLVEAQQTAAMLTTFNEIDMSAVAEIRRRKKEQFKARYGIGLGFMSFFARAVVGALRDFPWLNAEIQDNDIVIKHYYDIGIAVGVDDGLVVPIVRDADRKNFAQIEQEIANLAQRARENSLTLAELQGGTFTITNGGVYGSLMSTPILNTPQVGILGMHKIEERPVVVYGEITIRPMMYVALSYDHRIVDGSTAVRFLVRIKELLEDPEALMLEA